jgi:hypothetical protein
MGVEKDKAPSSVEMHGNQKEPDIPPPQGQGILNPSPKRVTT